MNKPDYTRYSTFGDLTQLARLRTAVEREIGEIEYDIKRTETRLGQLTLDLDNTRQSLREIDAYITDAVNKID